jgi:bifunctional non-homologous end joining protein LigD
MARSGTRRSQRQYVHVQNAQPLRIARELKDATGAPFPAYIEPALATLWNKPPDGDDWLHEIKFDGYRAQLHVDAGQVKLYTRRGHDWSPRFKAIAAAAGRLKTYAAILDGEVIVPTPEGRSDFGALERDLGAGRSDRLVYFVFDLLYLDGLDLRKCALVDRKRVLAALLDRIEGPIRYSDHQQGQGAPLYRSACRMELEGLVSKRAQSRYQSRRTTDWVKVTCRKRDTFVVAGIAFKGKKFDGIYLARRVGRDLLYAGKVENGFTPASERDLRGRAEALRVRKQPFAEPVRKPKAQWLTPGLLVDVEQRALTGDGKLRHPSFKGVREDLMDAQR